MTEILSKEIAIRSEHVDVNRLLRPSTLFRFFQEIALDHSTALGLGTEQTLHQNLLWVVTRYYVKIERMPAYEEAVELQTWPGEMRRVMFPRYFRMRSKNGEPLLNASSVWVLIDGAARKLIAPKQYGLEPVAGLSVGDELPYNVPPEPIAPQRTASFTVPYSYLDLNGHMNNTRYFDLCEDLIADEREGLRLGSIAAEYQNEVRYKQTLAVSIGRRENAFTFVGTTEQPCFRIGLQYERKD